jgi:hypothetical protein
MNTDGVTHNICVHLCSSVVPKKSIDTARLTERLLIRQLTIDKNYAGLWLRTAQRNRAEEARGLLRCSSGEARMASMATVENNC